MTQNERLVAVTAGVLLLIWFLKRGGIAAGVSIGPGGVQFGGSFGSSPSGGLQLNDAPPDIYTGSSSASGSGAASGGGCCGCPSTSSNVGPNVSNFGNYSQA